MVERSESVHTQMHANSPYLLWILRELKLNKLRRFLFLQIFLKREAMETPQLGFRTKASHTFSPNLLRNPVCPWCGSAPKPPSLRQNLLRNPVEPDLVWIEALSRPSPEPFPEPFPEPSPEPCWTWPSSAPKPSQPSPEPSPKPCWTWLGFAPRLPRTFSAALLNLTWLCTKSPQTFSRTFGTFYGTFSGTLLNVTWLCTKASCRPSPEPSEPSTEPRWTWPRRLHQCTPELFWAEGGH